MSKHAEQCGKAVVSGIQIVPLPTPNDGQCAFVSFDLDGKYRVNNVAIHSDLKNRDFRLTFPTKRLSNGSQIPIFYPTNKETGEVIRQAVVEKYLNLLSENLAGI